jgi:glutamine amidotransferase
MKLKQQTKWFSQEGEASSAMKMLLESGLDSLIPTLKQPVLGFV